MKITFANQTVELFPADIGVPKTVALLLSGGLDSASLLYLLCAHFPDMRILPITGIDAYAKFDTLCSYDVINFMHDEFPKNNILDQEVFSFDHKDPKYFNQALEMHSNPAYKNSPELALYPAGTSKNIQMRQGIDKVISKHKEVELLLMATTANPPNQLMKDRGFFDQAEHKRNEPHNRPVRRHKLYVPYINVNKKFVAGIYKHYKLLDSLYQYTNSCVGMPLETNYGQQDCGKCFWCHEKKWGFEDES